VVIRFGAHLPHGPAAERSALVGWEGEARPSPQVRLPPDVLGRSTSECLSRDRRVKGAQGAPVPDGGVADEDDLQRGQYRPLEFSRLAQSPNDGSAVAFLLNVLDVYRVAMEQSQDPVEAIEQQLRAVDE
jgi:hypothetical protein